MALEEMIKIAVLRGILFGYREAAKEVCAACGGRSYPDDKDYHQPRGPNAANNFVHVESKTGDAGLCLASSIWHRVRVEYGENQIYVGKEMRGNPEDLAGILARVKNEKGGE